MGFALSDTRVPKDHFTSEKYFIIRGLCGGKVVWETYD